MSTPPPPKSPNENGLLLLTTSETVLQMAQIARTNDNNAERRIFYSHLGYYCVRFRDYMERTRQTPSRLNSELVNQALNHLSALVPETVQELKSCAATSVQSRLGLLNSYWDQIQGQEHDQKSAFVRRWLNVGALKDQHSEVDQALGRCADDLDKQQPGCSPVQSEDASASPDIAEPSIGVRNATQSIFDALLDCKGCSCPSPHEFRAKLELGTYRRLETKTQKKPGTQFIGDHSRMVWGSCDAASGLDFDIFLSIERDWHEVHVQTIKERRVGFAIEGEVAAPRRGIPAYRSTKVEEICRPISKVKRKELQRLVLKLSGGQLFEMGFQKSIFCIDKKAAPISLARCFEERREFFTEKTKRILSLILGYAALHLNGTSWLQLGWGSENIEFFQTISCKTPLRPFIRTQLSKTSPIRKTHDLQLVMDDDLSDDDDWDDLDSAHRCPALVALAVLLMEVYFVKPFKRLADMIDIRLLSKRNGHVKPIDAAQVFYGVPEEDKVGCWSEIPGDSPLLAAIDNCLRAELWETEGGEALDPATLASRIYQKVVRHLEFHLTCGFSQIPLNNLDKYARNLDFGQWGQAISSHEPDFHTTTVTSSRVFTSLHAPSPASLLLTPNRVRGNSIGSEFQKHAHAYPQHIYYPHSHSVGHVVPMSNADVDYEASRFFDDEVGEDPQARNKYLKWKSEYEKVYEKFINNHPSGTPPQPVKIAILDTGIDRDHYSFEAREEQINKRRWNFYEESKNVADRNGHGTFTASLILDYAPDVELYVAKIADRDNARPEAMVVVNAINHAIDEWNVDIISMSFGWPSSQFEGHKALEDAIHKAFSKKVLMFAAASNSGGRRGRAYPASSPKVICVHSTDADGNVSKFNPTAKRNTMNIATVGESVQSAWPTLLCSELNREGVEYRSGTSYATAILSGTAAFLLQYARLHLPDAAPVLKEKDKMEALLERCAQRGRNSEDRAGYYCVDLSLNKHNLFGGELKGINHEILEVLKS